MNSIVIIGHSLAALENRLAFAGWKNLNVVLIVPEQWTVSKSGADFKNQSTPQGSQPEIRNLPCYAQGNNSLFLWRGLTRLLNQMKPDLLYSWEEPWCLSSWQVSRWAKQNGIPLVFFTAENRPKKLPWPFQRLTQWVFRCAKACVVPTPEIAENIMRMGYHGPKFLIPLSVSLRSSIPLQFEQNTFAYIGRLIPLKRVDLLIKTLTHLPHFHLRIIGDGPEGDNLKLLAKRLGVFDRVQFVGYIPNSQLENALQGCCCVVLPTAETSRQAEQFGKAVLEAVLCGLPCLVSPSGNLDRWCKEFPTVFALSLGDAQNLAQSLKKLWASPPSQKLLEESRLKVIEFFGPETIGKQMEKAFHSLLQEEA